jgi:hypothetical protein
MGIRDRPTAPRSPWQNAYVGRLIGSIRRVFLNHLIIVDARHLRNLLRHYAAELADFLSITYFITDLDRLALR